MDKGEGGSPADGGNRGKGALAGALAAAAVVAVVFGIWAWGSGREAGSEGAAPQVASSVPTSGAGVPQAAVPAATGTPAAETPAEVAAEVVAEPAATPPVEGVRFDMLRAAPGGAITVAGEVVPGAKVEVLLDGQVVDTVMAGADGKFASVTLGDPSAEPRELRVRTTAPDGTVAEPGESLTVAPDPATVAAVAATEAAAQEAAAQAEALAEKPIVSEAEGVRALAAASADLVIDTLAFDADGGIEISGRGAPAGSVLRAYVDTVEAGLVGAGPDGGWRMLLPGTAPGAHVLRVDALDAQGNVLARAETDFSAAPREVMDAAADPGEGGAPRSKIITIEQGYTLWAIAREAYGDPYLYVRVFEANRDQIRDPNLIYPGQVLTVPE